MRTLPSLSLNFAFKVRRGELKECFSLERDFDENVDGTGNKIIFKSKIVEELKYGPISQSRCFVLESSSKVFIQVYLHRSTQRIYHDLSHRSLCYLPGDAQY